MACSEKYGTVTHAAEKQGLKIFARMQWDVEAASAPRQTSQALQMVAEALERLVPDAIVLLGDRFETAAAAVAATLLGIPIVHLYGGEETEGAFDNGFRHAITKLSHLHFVAHQTYAQRVIRMGEAPATVHVVGLLAADILRKRHLPTRQQLESDLGLSLEPPVGLVTVHPTTLSSGQATDEVNAVTAAIDRYPATWIVTLPNVDPGNEAIRQAFSDLAASNARVWTVSALGSERYLGVMALSAFVLGNSSSGLTEAPTLRIPTVNVGDRQKGRIRSRSVIDVPCETDAILSALALAESDTFRKAVACQPLPFGAGDATARILAVLRAWTPPVPPRKVFVDSRPTERQPS
jgi:UDP-hydrolysing UDP-N-acetyl-D-glucosamine 2-epimerase